MDSERSIVGSKWAKCKAKKCLELRDALTVLAQLPAAFEHFNGLHPHSSLKMRSPREFIRQQTAGNTQARVSGSLVLCVIARTVGTESICIQLKRCELLMRNFPLF